MQLSKKMVDALAVFQRMKRFGKENMKRVRVYKSLLDIGLVHNTTHPIPRDPTSPPTTPSFFTSGGPGSR
jgi:hypothetical protein